MIFEYTRRRGARSALTGERTFRVDCLRQHDAGATIDVSHLIDRSYGYHSPRELRWHLAERFDLTPQTVALEEAR